MRPIPAVASTQSGVFTVRQALASGWTSAALRHAVDQGHLERLRRGIFALPLDPTGTRHIDATALLRRRAAAVSVANPHVPVSHTAAGAVLRLWLVDVPELVCITYPRGHRDDIAGTHRHRGRLHRDDLARVQGIRITSPERTVVDIARECGADAGVAAVDSGLRLGHVDPALLDAALQRAAGWPGFRAASRAVNHADAAAESALESISRLRIDDAGLPPPKPQMTIRGARGRFRGRTDFYWDEFGVVGEADGMAKYDDDEDRRSLRDEKRRQERMEDDGLIVVRWGWEDLSDFGVAADRLRRAFARGLRPDRAPRHWKAEPTRAWPRAIAAS